MKHVNSYNTEFGYELISALPYAYYLHKKGELVNTESAIDTKCLYYFSTKHTENKLERSWYNTGKSKNPNIRIHNADLDLSQFAPPPLALQYANDRFKFAKETVIICNRINIEWGVRPINFFDIPTLRTIFNLLKDKYQIIYINILGKKEYYDNEPAIDIKDYELLKEFPEVINIHELHKQNKDLTFNTLQLMLFANCKKYITMNGGHAILSAYFGGENIIMSKYGEPQARELSPNVNSFYRWYNIFGNQRIIHVKDEVNLVDKITTNWVECKPIVNILIRTSERPLFFQKCIESIEKQDYKNINVFVSYDNEKTNKYIIPYKVYPVKVRPFKGEIKPINNDNSFGQPFQANLYLNELHKRVQNGIVMYLDDDDCLTENTVLSQIVRELQQNDLVFWNVKNGDRIIPKRSNFGKKPVVCDISGIGFAFKKELFEGLQWTEYKRGDYRIANELYKRTNKIAWIDKVLTKTQVKGAGWGLKIDKKIGENMEDLTIEILNDTTKHGVITYKNKPLVIGSKMTINYDLAMVWIKLKVAKIFREPEIEPELPITTEPEIKYEKKVVEPVKRGGRKK